MGSLFALIRGAAKNLVNSAIPCAKKVGCMDAFPSVDEDVRDPPLELEFTTIKTK